MTDFDRSRFVLDFGGAASRRFRSHHLQPYAGALAAYALWADLRPCHARAQAATVIRDQGSWWWCGGFAEIEQGAKSGTIEARVIKPKMPRDQVVAAMWFEALHAAHLPTEQIYRWRSLVARHLPHNLIGAFFGPRGMTPTSCARILGRTRQTVIRYWDARHD